MPTRIPHSILKTQDRTLMQAVRKIADAVQRMGQRAKGKGKRRAKDARCPLPVALLVGGFVRDLVLKRHPKDADLEVYGVDAKKLERMLKKMFPKRVKTFGKSFGVFNVMVSRTINIDVSIPRRESKVSKGHKGFAIHGDPKMKIADAARRRDFTMNAMLLDPLTGEIVDPFKGLVDLKTHTLRIVDPKTFGDDPLRVYRALQFAARFGMETDPKTTALLRKMVKDGATDELPKERITEEMRKLLLLAERPSIGFELARIIGLLERDCPELHKLTTCVQKSAIRLEGTAWAHTMLVVDAMARIIRDQRWKIAEDEKLPLMLTAICHDLGKTNTPWRVSHGRTLGYVDHPAAGAKPAASLLKRFTFGEAINRNVATLTVHHRQGGVILDRIQRNAEERIIANDLRMLIRDIHPWSWTAYLAMSAADTLGVTGWDAKKESREIVSKLDRVVKKYSLIKEAKRTLITGTDLVRLGVPEGMKIGLIIEEIKRDRDAGRITTRKDALALAKTLAAAKMVP